MVHNVGKIKPSVLKLLVSLFSSEDLRSFMIIHCDSRLTVCFKFRPLELLSLIFSACLLYTSRLTHQPGSFSMNSDFRTPHQDLHPSSVLFFDLEQNQLILP
ncbi:hypothetical protein ATANTOWER_022291 [Ataeniobius toweri]|uniref:Uncharacterized protein n=1 Tax=Ataeniobius toweri TaxID=208326 RepID=A0ABU7A942_9TELE|nr:hypothetical protein [Ataeniobius toweri]